MQNVVHNNVAICCVEMLRPFGQALSIETWIISHILLQLIMYYLLKQMNIMQKYVSYSVIYICTDICEDKI